MTHNIPLIAMMCTSVGLLFTSMVLSSMASTAANAAGCDEKAGRFSMYSAVISGLAALIISVGLGLYIYRAEAIDHARGFLNRY